MDRYSYQHYTGEEYKLNSQWATFELEGSTRKTIINKEHVSALTERNESSTYIILIGETGSIAVKGSLNEVLSKVTKGAVR